LPGQDGYHQTTALPCIRGAWSPRRGAGGRRAGRPGSRIGDAAVATRGSSSMRARVAGLGRFVRRRETLTRSAWLRARTAV